MSFAAEADTCIGRRVLYENRRFHRSCKTGEMIDILRVHVRRVTIAVLCLYRQIDRFVDIAYANNGKNGHHQFVLYEGMIEIRFTNDTTNIGTHFHADLFQKYRRVTTYTVTADCLFHDARLGIFNVHKHDIREFCSLLRADFVRAVLLHFGNKFVRNVSEYEHFLFRDTRQVVIERTTVDDILTGFLNVCGVIHDNGRVTRARTDCFLTARKHRSYNARAARTNEQADVGMLIHDLRRIERGFDNRRYQNLRTACHCARAIDKVYRIVGGCDCVGVGVEHHAVPCGDHTDTITNNRFRRIGTRSDTAYYAERRHFRQGQAVIARFRVGNNIRRAGGLVRNENMFRGLMGNASHFRFRNAKVRHYIGFLAAKFTNRCDNLFAFFKRHSAYCFVPCRRRVNRVVHIRIYTDISLTVVLRSVPICLRRYRAAVEILNNRGNHFFNLCFSPIDCHYISPYLLLSRVVNSLAP